MHNRKNIYIDMSLLATNACRDRFITYSSAMEMVHVVETPLISSLGVHRQQGRDKSVPTGISFLTLIASLLLISVFTLPTMPTFAQGSASPKVQMADWPTFLDNTQRNAATTDTTISTSNASQLVKHWSFQTGGVVASSPTVVNGTVYVGSWNGYEYALNAKTGTEKWATYLGITTVRPDCNPSSGAGVSSAATVQNGVAYVGGGDSYWYALNAATGAVLWRVYTGDNSVTGGYYNWSSPLIYNGYAYIGLASFGDCPLAQGKLLRVSLATHQIVNTFNVVPNGQIGGGIWTTPSIDTITNTIYVDTGTENSLSQPYAQAFLALDATTLTLKDSWKLPEGDAVMDSDFSTTPILFNDAAGNLLVSGIDKNGYAYTFKRGHLAAGPIWKAQIATGGDCPEPCGQGSVSSGAFAQNKLFLAGEDTLINGVGYKGSVRAFDPGTGKILWQHSTVGRVIGALAYSNGILVDGAGPVFEVLNAQTGDRLFDYTTGGTLYAAPSIAEGQIYIGGVDGNVYAFGLPTTPVQSPPADAHCPKSWTCQDIGGSAPKGSESVTNTGWTIHAGGAGITGTSDQFRLMTQTLNHNLQISTQVTVQGTSNSTQAGLMIRQSNDPTSQYYAVLLTQGKGLVVQYRFAQGGTIVTDVQMPTATAPLYLEIQRVGDQFQAATSTDGIHYTLVPGSTATIAMPARVFGGLAVSSGSTTATSTVTFRAVTSGVPTTPPTVIQSATLCPTGWSCQDIGNPALVGNQSFDGTTWTVQGVGTDIGNYTDQFHYVWQTIAADGVVSAHITAQTNTSNLAKAGVMLRQNTTSGSVYYGAFVTPGTGVSVQYRSTFGPDGIVALTTSGTTPLYLEVARSGSNFSTYTSTDGVNWSYLPGSTVTMNVTGSMLAGIAVTSNNPAQLGQATFDTVNVGTTAPAPPACPTGWTCGDIGYPTPMGSQSVTGNAWSIVAGGGDIWGTADSFHYIWQNMASDGSVSAHVTAQTNTSAYAKTGVMMRQTTDADSAYYLAAVTPGQGIQVQYRSAQGAVAAESANISGTVPTYLQVSRTGSSFSAYTSSDGVNWTLVPGSTVTVNMSGTILEGVASTSHNTAAACFSTVDSVTVS